jgi:sugar/nucleoside kinase (ribokinase family)
MSNEKDFAFDVVGVGCATVDMLAIYDGPIDEDQKVLVRQTTRQGGGLVGTGLVAVARLGGRARFVGKLGDDDHARFIVDDFKHEGVDTSCIQVVPGASAIRTMGLINPAKGHRTLFVCLDDAPEVLPSDLKRADVLAGKVVFVDGFIVKAAIQAAEWGREAGRQVLMDAEMTAPENDRLADLSTHVVASLHFAQDRVGPHDARDCARRLFDRLSRNDPEKVVGVTSGAQGSWFVTRDGEFHQPAFKPPLMVDTTGCGDVFHGAFALGLAREMPLQKIAEFAAAVAAIKCRMLGGRAGIPNLAETEALIRGVG